MVVLPAWMRILIASSLCFLAVAVAAFYITPSTPAWYASLSRPGFFAIPLPAIFFVLIVTAALSAIASSLMWIHDPRQWDFRGWVPLFFAHLLMEAGWLILFFGYNVVFVSMIVAFFLATLVLMLTAAAWQRNKIAFWLLLAYLIWTLYALGMNIAVWTSN